MDRKGKGGGELGKNRCEGLKLQEGVPVSVHGNWRLRESRLGTIQVETQE